MNPDRTYPNLGHVVIADRVITSRPDPRRALHIILLLAASVGIVMTGFGLIMPVFARRLNEFGSGVEALGIMTMAFALGALLASPVMGSLADRIGRRPLILLSLASFVGVNIGFLFAPSTEVFIAIRAAEGVLTAGLMPAAMGVAADIVPEHQRAQRVGIVMGSMGAGIIFGPVIGGVLYDSWGFSAPFIGSAILAFAALIFAFSLVPETRTQEVRRRERLRRRRTASTQTVVGETVWSSLPRPIVVFAALLLLDSIIVFEYTFIEPQMIFYFYNELEWSTIQFGIVVAASGVAIVVGQLLFGRSSDRLGAQARHSRRHGAVLGAPRRSGLRHFVPVDDPVCLCGRAGAGVGDAGAERLLHRRHCGTAQVEGPRDQIVRRLSRWGARTPLAGGRRQADRPPGSVPDCRSGSSVRRRARAHSAQRAGTVDRRGSESRVGVVQQAGSGRPDNPARHRGEGTNHESAAGLRSPRARPVRGVNA